ncbi:unnamed protein product [Didymodactylos carnosus]|uniref:Uncharacterized protein n=1 Tax=Didymodactylos carnosus TaxID=1234261 RepID=A0A815VU89_9BILA|nr:unnamed protein product [Didymodactylos carnosus]CAF1534902.1 unnamed protein product [Didymodactylos carnosus]CAF3757782.1 unnamed protein product [Didymodactylos carnosus]CAF4394610.1 unnamed protein product [Didymodactylos carnosus]
MRYNARIAENQGVLESPLPQPSHMFACGITLLANENLPPKPKNQILITTELRTTEADARNAAARTMIKIFRIGHKTQNRPGVKCQVVMKEPS